MLADFKAKDLFPTLVAPDVKPHGGTVSAGDSASLSAPRGVVWATVDGSDPRLRGGEISRSAFRVNGDVPIETSGTLSARTLLGTQWSALVRVQFNVR